MIPMPMRTVTPLKLAIVASGRRQKDIAAAVELDEATMSRIVNGLRVKPEVEARIAGELGVSVEALFGSDHAVRAA